jgi:hypothetical protein
LQRRAALDVPRGPALDEDLAADCLLRALALDGDLGERETSLLGGLLLQVWESVQEAQTDGFELLLLGKGGSLVDRLRARLNAELNIACEQNTRGGVSCDACGNVMMLSFGVRCQAEIVFLRRVTSKVAL